MPVTITYDIIGNVTGAQISALVTGTTTGLPNGIVGQTSQTFMIRDIDVTGGGNTVASESFKIFINGEEREYVATGTVSAAIVAKGLANVINAEADGTRDVNADADTVSGTVRLTARTIATYFSVSYQETSAALGMTTTTLPEQGVGVFIISGTPTDPVSSPTRYTYTINTTGSSCTPGTAVGYIVVEPNSAIMQTSVVGTENQELCVGEPLIDVTFEVYNGATGASIAPLSGLNGLPNGVGLPSGNGQFTAQQPIDEISFSGSATGTDTETYSLILSVQGAGTHTVSYSAPPSSTVTAVITGLTSATNQFAKRFWL